MIGLNCGSGQRPFEGWINFDIQLEVHDYGKAWHPDLVADMFHMPFKSGCADYVVSSHTLEHLGCGEGAGFIQESFRVLKHGGSFIISVPDIRALAQRWLLGQIDDYIYMVNMMGAYRGSEHDRHKWHYTFTGLGKLVMDNGNWSSFKRFNNRKIEGMDLAQDWWILSVECVK